MHFHPSHWAETRLQRILTDCSACVWGCGGLWHDYRRTYCRWDLAQVWNPYLSPLVLFSFKKSLCVRAVDLIFVCVVKLKPSTSAWVWVVAEEDRNGQKAHMELISSCHIPPWPEAICFNCILRGNIASKLHFCHKNPKWNTRIPNNCHDYVGIISKLGGKTEEPLQDGSYADMFLYVTTWWTFMSQGPTYVWQMSCRLHKYKWTVIWFHPTRTGPLNGANQWYGASRGVFPVILSAMIPIWPHGLCVHPIQPGRRGAN